MWMRPGKHYIPNYDDIIGSTINYPPFNIMDRFLITNKDNEIRYELPKDIHIKIMKLYKQIYPKIFRKLIKNRYPDTKLDKKTIRRLVKI